MTAGAVGVARTTLIYITALTVATAVQIRLTAVQAPVSAAGIGTHVLVAEAAGAITGLPAVESVAASITLFTSAVHIRLVSVLLLVFTRRLLAAALFAHIAHAMRILLATFAIFTRVTAPATVDVCLTFVFDLVAAACG